MQDTFLKWLENAAATHPDILHQGQEGARAFFMRSVERWDEFTHSEIGEEKRTIVVCLYPEVQHTTQEELFYNNYVFMVLTRAYVKEELNAISAAYAKSEAVLLSFLAKLHRDEEKNRFFLGSGSLNELSTASPIANDPIYFYGYMQTVKIASKYNWRDDGVEWTDGGLTNPAMLL